MRNPEGDPPSKWARKRFVQQKELSDCYISVRPTNVKMSVSVQSALNVKMSVSVQSALNVKMSVSVQSAFNREESVRSKDLILHVSAR